MDSWKILSEKLKKYSNRVLSPDYKKAITTAMPRTFLLGNGDMGVVSNGDRNSKEYLISKGDFWSCGNLHTDDPMGVNPKKVTIITVGGVRIKELSASCDSETLDLSTGELTSVQGSVTFRANVIADKNMLIIDIVSDCDQSVIVESYVKSDIAEYRTKTYEKAGNWYVERQSANFAREDKNSWISAVAMGVFCINGDMSFSENTDSSVKYRLELKKGEHTKLAVCIGGGGKTLTQENSWNSDLPYREISEMTCNITVQSLDNDIEKTRSWWKEYWLRSYVDLGIEELEKYYYGSLYITAISSRENKLATGLYGNLITTDNPKWQGDYHLNYNLIAPFYGMNAANRGEFSLPVKDVLLPYIEEGKRRAKKDLPKICKQYIFGGKVKGIYFPGREELADGIDDAVLYPVALGPYGTTAWSENGGYLSQIMDAAFSAMGLTAYYFYTLDGDFLREIYEFLRLNINFYIGWREKEELGNGKYRYNLWSGAHEETFEMNSPMVLGCVKNILKCVLDGVYRGYLEVDNVTVNVWRDFLDNIAEYPIRRYTYRKGFKKQVYDVVPLGEIGMNVGTGATVALEFIQPCDELDFSSDKKLMEACRNLITVNKLNNKEIFRQINNLPKIFVHAIRCGYNPEMVLQEFLNLYRHDFRYNYTVDDGDVHGVEKSGGIEFINSMLIQSNVETIKVFPNWLSKQTACFVNLRARGAYVVSAWYDGERKKVSKIEIISEKQNEISIVNNIGKVKITDSENKAVEFVEKISNYASGIITFTCKIGEKYIIEGV